MKRTRSDGITKLEDSTSRSICSAQVITSLWSAIKEVVENSMDAKATFVDVAVTGHGADTIEVRDDGTGIDPERMSMFGTLNITSKLRSFNDVHAVTSFGFRGEALSALCQLSEGVRIVSKRKGQGATYAMYVRGALDSHGPEGAFDGESGTLLRITNLFETLPVRRTHFVSKAKKDFAATVLRMQQYCLMACLPTDPGIVRHCRVRLLHNGAVVMASQPRGSILDAVTCVAGVKTAKAMREMSWNVKASEDEGSSVLATIRGAVGSVPTSSSSLQYLYLNGRPVDLPKVQRALASSCPDGETVVYVCDIMMQTGCTDVNMAPDKRTVAIKGEDRVCAEVFKRAVELHAMRQAEKEQKGAMSKMVALSTPQKEFQFKVPQTPSTVPAQTGTARERIEALTTPTWLVEGPPGEKKNTEATEELLSTPKRQKRGSEDRHTCCEHEGNETVEGTSPPTIHRPMSPPAVPTVEEDMIVVDHSDLDDDTHGTCTLITIPLDGLVHHDFSQSVQVSSDAAVHDVVMQDIPNILHTTDFSKMRVLGQFNMGFIVTELQGNLFVVDQHAADEKRTYEDLVTTAEASVRPQNVLLPLPIGLSLAAHGEELHAMADKLLRNGIRLQANPTSGETRVVAVPTTAGIAYTSQEVEGVLTQLLECPFRDRHSLPETVRRKLASKACRSSIMIGTALDQRTMRSVVERLSGLIQPWNCPHGRPTVRRIATIPR